MFGFGKLCHRHVIDHQPDTTPDDAQQAQQQLYDDQGNPTQPDNKGSFGHEVLAAGAGFMAMRQYQKHEEANGSSTHPSLFPRRDPTLPATCLTSTLVCCNMCLTLSSTRCRREPYLGQRRLGGLRRRRS